jgi:OmpA-OmpF porin, OOP family
MFKIAVLLLLISTAAAAALTATIPTADKQDTKDSPLLKRYDGSRIVVQERKEFAELALPLSKLEPVKGEKTQQNNERFEPKARTRLQGTHTRTAYLIPENRSGLEVIRNYEEAVSGAGGKVLYQCSAAECGGDPSRSSGGGGGRMSLAMYLYPPERVVEQRHTVGHCAVAERINDQRYLVAELPERNAHVSVLVYQLVSPNKHDSCHALNGRTIAVVDLLEAKAIEQKMVTVPASEMEKAIASTGRIALYGIYFDFNKAEVKPESDATLQEIAKLLKQSSGMKLLVVGHTDNVGTFPFNMELSQRRATAVAAALAARHNIAKDRLSPVGVSFASPIASNKTDDGRAKNRRVELVEN